MQNCAKSPRPLKPFLATSLSIMSRNSLETLDFTGYFLDVCAVIGIEYDLRNILNELLVSNQEGL
ncbi:hypothetical protein [Candidatus Methanomassiliicoccus intestinalis]|uniref:hypothetical protein n=1 Tax=Candidatus Methanomassiliicoccus intestinalis TaxID=1406512 RepID=UPI0037DC4649